MLATNTGQPSESLIEVHKAITNLSDIALQIAPNVARFNLRRTSSRAAGTFDADGNDDTSTIGPTIARPDSVVFNEAIEGSTSDGSSVDTPTSFTTRFDFEDALESSRPYRRAPQWDKDDISFHSSALNAHAWSRLSKFTSFSLGDISIISVLALPITSSDISNTQHYTFVETSTSMPLVQERTRDSDSTKRDLQSHIVPNLSPAPAVAPHSPPQSPKTDTEAHSQASINVLNNMFGLGRPLYPLTPPMSPASPITTSLEVPKVDDSSYLSLQNLSQLSIEKGEIHLCHKDGGPPCRGAVDMAENEEVCHWNNET